jgi:hypothetical protein
MVRPAALVISQWIHLSTNRAASRESIAADCREGLRFATEAKDSVPLKSCHSMEQSCTALGYVYDGHLFPVLRKNWLFTDPSLRLRSV